MRLVLRDIDDFAVTPADLSDLGFEGSPDRVELAVDGGEAECVVPDRSASLDRPTGSLETDESYDLSRLLEPPCDATVTWPGGTCHLSVVSYHYCTIDEVLGYGDEKRQSPRKLGRSEEDAYRARAEAETVCDDLCGRPFRATYRKEEAWEAPSVVHQLDWPTLRVLTPGWTIVGDGLVKRYRPLLCSSAEMYRGPSRIEYVSGEDAGVPTDVRRAVARLAASYLTVSKVPDRAVYESTETGMTRYTLADSEHTGIPDVDAVFARHARKRWAVL